MIDILIGVVLDWILGDPYSFPHPVKLMGNLIAFEDRHIRSRLKEGRSLRLAGLLVALFNIGLSFFLGWLILRLASLNKYLYRFVRIYLIYACIAARSLSFEAKKVAQALNESLEKGRYQLSFIVGRDTSSLEPEEIVRATIETVAENTSDGVIAPLFFIGLLGPAGGLMYKMVNTMDSMLGYKNEKYLDFGRYPALIDDLYNYIPARITGLLMCLAGLVNYDMKKGFSIMLRDNKKHASPNAGYPEGAVAGLLGIRLGGDGVYHGKTVKKASLGDSINKLEERHIGDTIRIMYRTEILYLLIFFLIKINI